MDCLSYLAAAYYLTHAVTRTDGVYGVFYRLRGVRWLPLHCAACSAFWAAIAVYYLPTPLRHIAALAGAVTAVFVVIEFAEHRQLAQGQNFPSTHD